MRMVVGWILSRGKRWFEYFSPGTKVNNPIWWSRSTSVSGIGSLNLKMEGEYVVELGIIHTCTALRYKPAFIATRYGRVLDFCAECRGFDRQPGQKVMRILFTCYTSTPVSAPEASDGTSRKRTFSRWTQIYKRWHVMYTTCSRLKFIEKCSLKWHSVSSNVNVLCPI